MTRSINVRGTTEAALTTSTGQGRDLQTRMHVPGGRVFRYAKAGEALSAGDLVQAAHSYPLHTDLTVTQHEQGKSSQVTVNIGVLVNSAVFDKDYYKDGFLYVNNGTLEGRVYGITSSKHLNTGLMTVTLDGILDPDNPNTHAVLTADTRVTLIKNEYDGVVKSDTALRRLPIGVAPTTVASGSYFWVQTFGPAAVLQEGTLYPNKAVSASDKVKGAVASYLTPTDLVSETGNVNGSRGEANIKSTTTIVPVRSFPNDNLTSNADLFAETSAYGALVDQIVGYTISSHKDTDKALIRLTLLN